MSDALSAVLIDYTEMRKEEIVKEATE